MLSAKSIKITTLAVTAVFLFSFLPAANAAGAVYKVGDRLTFGQYPQRRVVAPALISQLCGLETDGRGEAVYKGIHYRKKNLPDGTAEFFVLEPVSWRVISVKESRVEILSEKVLDAHAYSTCITKDSAWENSSLRIWLNDVFYNTAFTDEEKSRIRITQLNNNDGHEDEYTGPDTADRIYIPSFYDVDAAAFLRLFPSHGLGANELRRSFPTDFARSQGAEGSPGASWWLRTRYSYDGAFRVYPTGEIGHGKIDNPITGVCPALCFSADGTSAAPFEINCRFENGEALITGFRGACPKGLLTIPELVQGEPVTEICACAFLNCTEITGVVLPVGVKYIGSFAFAGCTRLRDVYFSGSCRLWSRIFFGENNAPLLNAEISCNYDSSAALPAGDVDADGTVTAADARLALRAAVGLEKLTPARFTAADVDGNQSVTAADARKILRAAVGLEVPAG